MVRDFEKAMNFRKELLHLTKLDKEQIVLVTAMFSFDSSKTPGE